MTKSIGALCVAWLSLGATAQASSITFTSGAAFLAALSGSGTVVEGYQTLPPNTIIADGTTLNGLTYTVFPFGTDGRIASGEFASLGGQSLALDRAGADDYFFPGDSFTVSFPNAVDAVGIYFNVAPSAAGSLGIATSAGSAVNGAAYDFSTLYFVGLLSDSSFTSATFFSTPTATSGFNVDNLTYRVAANPVPEPGSLLLLGTGGVLLLAKRFRRRTKRGTLAT